MLRLESEGLVADVGCAYVRSEGATLVSFGGMETSAVTVPLSTLVDNDITVRVRASGCGVAGRSCSPRAHCPCPCEQVRGFNFAKWMSNASAAERDELVAQALDDAKSENVRILLAREPFQDFEHALKRSQEAGERKVVLVM